MVLDKANPFEYCLNLIISSMFLIVFNSVYTAVKKRCLIEIDVADAFKMMLV